MSFHPSSKPVLAAASLLLATACSHESGRDLSQFTTMEPQTEKITKFADANHDGKITREEAKVDPNLEKVFDQYDLDKNGILDRAEFARLEADSREARAENLAGRNEALDTHEFRGHPLAHSSGDSLNRTGERGP